MYQDETLVCKDCGEQFVFTAGEQEFYHDKGFQNKPQRCKSCRQQKKSSGGGQREMHTGVCASCGGVATVPFKIQDPSRPIYCSDCFARMNEGR
jgi:CxxC-x17-CxxC domain-containing protein